MERGPQDRGQRPWGQAQLGNGLSVRPRTAHLSFLLNLYLLIYKGTNTPNSQGRLETQCDLAGTFILRRVVTTSVCSDSQSVAPTQTSHVSSTWELVRNAESQASLQTCAKSDTLGVGSSGLCFNKLSRLF